MTDEYFTIDSVLGQDKAKKMLRRAVGAERLGHAYLFRGPTGVGKKTLAKAFGLYLNCQSPTEGQDACGSCSSCRKFKPGSHADLLIIEPDTVSIKINQIRELKHALTFPPLEARHRIVLITDIHTMRREAANSLLKILEEPPPDNQLILTGDGAGGILPTILSRCQVIPFSGLSREVVAKRLLGTGIEPDEAASLAAIADGSLGRAKMLVDSELLESRRAIIARLVEIKKAGKTSTPTVFALAEQAAGLADRLPDLLDLLKLWFRDMIMLSRNLPGEIVNRDLPNLADSSSIHWTTQQLLDKLELFDRAHRQLSRNCNRTPVCEDLFFGLL